MACTVYADFSDWETFWTVNVPDDTQALINRYLEMAASDIHAALAAQGACDCTLAAWATEFLKKLNVIDAAALFKSPCGPHLTAEERATYIEWITAQLTNIRNGTMELCAGETGSEFPAVGFADIAVDEFTAATIIANDIQRNS